MAVTARPAPATWETCERPATAFGRCAALDTSWALPSALAIAIAATGGHATLVRADDEVRARVPVFEPQPARLGQLTARIKEAFDPKRVLNPGRMYEGV